MAKYFIDTEFLEGPQKKGFFGKKTKPTIDLISIGIVDEDGREFYAISNEFNLKEAWDRWDKVECCSAPQMCISQIDGHCEGFKRNYWIRENVLRPIYDELLKKERYARENCPTLVKPFSYKTLKTLIDWNGRLNAEIANGVCAFIYGDDCGGSGMSAIEMAKKYEISDKTKEPNFYAYYASYDWVVFCWLFGRMIDLPKGFPMHCNDIKQTMDDIVNGCVERKEVDSFKEGLFWLKHLDDYPTNKQGHHALSDAKFDKELFLFLEKLKKRIE